MGHTLNGNSGIVEIDLYTIAANIYIERGAHIAEGLILYGPLPPPPYGPNERTSMYKHVGHIRATYIHVTSD